MVIGICDDDIRTGEELRDEILKYNQRMNIESEICLFQSGQALLEAIDEKTETMQILFLDIEMPEMDGFEVAKCINEQKKDIIQIFVSSHDERVYEALDFHPFHFIRKEYPL
jgi:DNA-binding LytR/AlgR family response regulator